MKCPSCQAENSPSAKFCSQCGTALLLRCSNCQTELTLGDRFCKYCGQAVRIKTPDDEARHNRLASIAPAQLASKALATSLTGERRIVSILFADVVSSTHLIEELDIETWTSIMNGALDLITPAIYQYEGTIARLLGDSLVAFFGAPIAHEDDPIRAVRAALDCLEPIAEYAKEIKRNHDIDFAMRFCLNTGPVIIGPVGNDLRYEYTSSSGAVNLASRLKFATQPMTVIISENTYRLVEPLFEINSLGVVDVKGRQEPLEAYQVLGRKTIPGSLRGLVGLESPMVGRDKELTDLLQLCEYLQSGLGRAVLVTGEPGFGKSRLISEWENAVATTQRIPPPQWVEGRCLSYGQSMAYHLVLDLLRSVLGVSDGASESEVCQKFHTLIIDLYGDLDHPAALDVYPYLGHLLSCQLQGEAYARVNLLDPQGLQARYSSAMSALLKALASQRPLLLILEDLHWADPASIELLLKLLPLVFNSQILFTLISRPDLDSPGWRLVTKAREMLGGSLSEITLNALSESDSRELVANLLEIEALPKGIRKMILDKAEGNPFFVEEVVRMLIDQEAIVRNGDKWRAGENLSAISIPNNLQGLLMARIDRLSENGKKTLRVASVVGRQFPVRVLQDVLLADQSDPDPEVSQTMSSLSNLESAGLIRLAQVEPDLEYNFRHNLIQNAAYESLLLADRKRLHLMVGETVERVYPDRLDSRELAPRLGQHFSEAGDDKRALKYFTLAGNAALDSFANIEAEDQYRCALSLVCTELERAVLLDGLGEALARQSRYEEAIQIWFEAIDFYQEANNLDGVAQLHAKAARAAWWHGDTPRGLEICLDGLKLVTNAPESHEIALLIHETARAYHFNGIPEKAADLCQQALEMAERLGDIEVQADALATLGILANQPPDVAIQAATKAVELAEEAKLLNIAIRANLNLGTVRQSFDGDSFAARKNYERALELARRRGVPQEEFITLLGLVGLLFDLGEIVELEKMLPELESLVSEISDPGSANMELLGIQAGLHSLQGEHQKALELLNECREEARRRGDLQHLSNFDYQITGVYLDIHWSGEEINWHDLEEKLREAIDIGERGVASSVWPMSFLSIAYTLQENYEAAHRLLEKSIQAKSKESSMWSDLAVLQASARLAAAEGHWEQSFTAYEKVYNICSQSNMRWFQARTLSDWADALTSRGEPTDFESARQLFNQSLVIYSEMGATWYKKQVESRIQSVSEQVLVQAEVQGEIALEMAEARRVQASFLPDELPEIPGYNLSVRIEPVRETSGDFFDTIPLPDNHLGIVVADVADKGAAAALFMTSTRTLIRTYAEEYPSHPEQVIETVNRRLLQDTHSGLFVTVFFGVLDIKTNILTYVNAGHNPPLVASHQREDSLSILEKTGMPIGILEDVNWECENHMFSPGDVLVIYTDGVTEAQSAEGKYYGEGRLKQVILTSLQNSKLTPLAEDIVEAILTDHHTFRGQNPRSDDTTILVLIRENEIGSDST
jgi:serine phosphatase RsbU (regulator of sigma subunit)/class 3 adenylate cyclase